MVWKIERGLTAIEWHSGWGNYLKTSVTSSYRVFLEGSSSTLLTTAMQKVAAGLWLVSCCLFFPRWVKIVIVGEVILKMPVLWIGGEDDEHKAFWPKTAYPQGKPVAEMDPGRVALDVGTSNVAYFLSTAARQPDLYLNLSFDQSRRYG